MVHGQCVRQQVCDRGCKLRASWRLSLDCNHKCWEDAAPVARHSLRLALADHFDVPFQEAHQVRLRKDDGSPTTHAHLHIVVNTRRLTTDLGNLLLASFLANASIASEILGLVVHTVEHQVRADDGESSSHSDQGANASLIDAATASEDEDEYAQYYVPLEKNAELAQSKASGEPSVAGVPVPSFIPTIAIVAVAGGIVVLLAALIGCLFLRRRRLLAQQSPNNTVEKTVEADVPAEKSSV